MSSWILSEESGKKEDSFFSKLWNNLSSFDNFLEVALWRSFFWKKKKRKTVFDKLCENTVDEIYQTFTRKHYLVRISQSKTSHIYCKKKKGGGCCLRKRMCFTAEFLMSLEVFLVGFVKNRHFWRKEFF